MKQSSFGNRQLTIKTSSKVLLAHSGPNFVLYSGKLSLSYFLRFGCLACKF